MPARKKGAVRKGHGIMCNICGLNCGKGGALSRHVKGKHEVTYASYKACFYPRGVVTVADAWDNSTVGEPENSVLVHVLVRRFAGNPGTRGVPRAARVIKSRPAKRTAKKR